MHQMQFEVDEAGIQVEELQHQLEDALKVRLVLDTVKCPDPNCM